MEENLNETTSNGLERANYQYKVAQYTVNRPGGTVCPVFNEGYNFALNEIDNGNGTYTIEIYANEDFTSCNFFDSYNEKFNSLLSVEYLKITNKVTITKANKKLAGSVNPTFIPIILKKYDPANNATIDATIG
jgi:hypothetical protein